MPKYRAQILLEPEQHKALVQLAAQEGRSVSDMVREIVSEYLTDMSADLVRLSRLEALKTARQVRQAIRSSAGEKSARMDINKLIQRTREERDDRILTGLSDDRT